MMRMSSGVNEELLEEARAVSGIRDRVDLINQALRLFIQVRKREGLRRLRGKVTWEGNLDELRRGRWFDADS